MTYSYKYYVTAKNDKDELTTVVFKKDDDLPKGEYVILEMYSESADQQRLDVLGDGRVIINGKDTGKYAF